jgi:hypothetical protein
LVVGGDQLRVIFPAGVTVKVVFPEMLPEVAVMVVVPAPRAVARPLVSTVATDVLDELQMTCVVISCVVPSEYVPEALNCLVAPVGMLGLAGVTDIDDRIAWVTVKAVFPEMLPEVAVMVVVPAPRAVARPLVFTVATDVLDELQMTCVVISCVVPSEYVPEALNCLVAPTGIGLAGVTDMETREGADEELPPPPPPPQ